MAVVEAIITRPRQHRQTTRNQSWARSQRAFITAAPRRPPAPAAARPRPPRTRPRRRDGPAPVRVRSVRSRSRPWGSPELEGGEGDHGEEGGDDPEAQHDLRFRPALVLEVVVDRRAEEHPLSAA